MNKRNYQEECAPHTSKMGIKNHYDLKFYKSEITNIVNKINDAKFLRRIYISLRDYYKEKSE